MIQTVLLILAALVYNVMVGVPPLIPVPIGSLSVFMVTVFACCRLTFFITWIFNHTRSSLLMPVVLHLTFNIVNTILLPVTLNVTAFTLFILLILIVPPRLTLSRQSLTLKDLLSL